MLNKQYNISQGSITAQIKAQIQRKHKGKKNIKSNIPFITSHIIFILYTFLIAQLGF